MPVAIDTHAHLNDTRLRRRLDDVLARARENGVTDIIDIGWDVEMSELAVQQAQELPGVWATAGIHPHEAQEESTPEHRARLRELARAPRVVAVGETGLDFYRNLSPRPAQYDALHWHLDLARELDLPVMLHCRDAQDELMDVLAGYPGLQGSWHCFDGTAEHAARAVSLGLHLGFGGMITYKKADDLRRALAATPLDRVLLETDAPYLAPEPDRRRDNEPALVVAIGRYAAEVRGEAEETLFAATTENARRLFRLT